MQSLSAWLIASLCCFLLVGSVKAASSDYFEALRECLSEDAKSTGVKNFDIDTNFLHEYLCQGPNSLALRTRLCMGRGRDFFNVKAENFPKVACKMSHNSKANDDALSTLGIGASFSLLPKADIRTSEKVRRNAKDDKKINKLSRGAIAGVAGGGGILFALLLGICGFCIYRRRSKRRTAQETLPIAETGQDSNACPLGDQKAELPSDEKTSPFHPQPNSAYSPIELPSTTTHTRFEMEGESSYQHPVEMPTSP